MGAKRAIAFVVEMFSECGIVDSVLTLVDPCAPFLKRVLKRF
jgi:hypothetical protein